MQYTTLGERTGLRVSVLGFGGMRLPMAGEKVDRDKAVPMIHRAFEMGVNYIDTAVGYCNADSQSAIGDALEGWRDRVIVSTKNGSYRRTDHDEWQKNLEDSLKRLKVDCIDIYNFHGLNWNVFREHVDGVGGSYRWIAAAKDQGLIKHICFSFHDTADALKKIAATGLFDVVTCQYNILDQSNAPAFEDVRKTGMGLVVMGPVGGGRLGAASAALRTLIPGARSVPEVAMRFVLANPHVNVALSGMSTMEQVEENCRVCARKTPLSRAQKRRVKAVLNRYGKLAKLYCTGCRYCMPCPHGVDIPGNFDDFNKLRVYGLKDLARNAYARSAGPARLCLACGRCMKKCPQHIEIIPQLRETVRALDNNYGKLDVRIKPVSARKIPAPPGMIGVDLDVRVECINCGDEAVSPAIAFRPAAGVAVAPGRGIGCLAPFARAFLPVRIRAAVGAGRGIETGLHVEAGRVETTMGSSRLSIVPAGSGGSRGLAGAVYLRVDEDDPACRARRGAAKKHGMTFAAAYDAKALYLRMKVRDDLEAVCGKERPVWRADRVLVELNLAGLVKQSGNGAPKVRRAFEAPIGIPAGGRTPVHVPGHGMTGKITARAGNRAGLSTIEFKCPWPSIDCPPGKKGRVLGFDVSHISYSRTGKIHCRRHWRKDGGWLALV